MSFEFPKVKITTIDISDAEMDKLKNHRQQVREGTHSLKITKLENKGPAKNDSTFIGVNIHFEAPNGGEIKKYYMLPTVRLKYGGSTGKKGELMPFQNLCKFFEALGEVANNRTVPDLVNKYFTKNTLVGRTVTAVVGYDSTHLAYIDGMFVVVDRDGTPFMTDEGDYVASGTDRDAALAAAANKGFAPDKIKRYPEIIRYIAEQQDDSGTTEADDSDF